MSLDLANEIWGELKRYVNAIDRNEAAESVVSILVDNDYDADEIKETFKSDAEIKRALAHYLKDHEEEVEEDYEDDYEDEDDDY